MTDYQHGKPFHGAGVEVHCDPEKDAYKPRHAVPRDLIEDIEWATGKNGTTFLSQIRAHRLDIVRVTS